MGGIGGTTGKYNLFNGCNTSGISIISLDEYNPSLSEYPDLEEYASATILALGISSTLLRNRYNAIRISNIAVSTV
jgi:hypothetical protein